MPETVLGEYRRRVAASALSSDAAQERVAALLDRLMRELRDYQPQRPQRGWRQFLSGSNDRAPPRGLYIWGGVGRGKSMLMDVFHALAPTTPKRRVHFHVFMQDVHSRIHSIRRKQASGHIWDDVDPIKLVAQELSGECHLLCFDEFQVTDITDAMILGRLFEALLAEGMVTVATSNTSPDELYRGGLNRHAFTPFIALLKERMEVVSIEAGRDYRRDRIGLETSYVTPLGPRASDQIEHVWRELTDGSHRSAVTLHVLGRPLEIPEAADGVARFSFGDLCEAPLGPADYIALAEAFHTLVVEGIPQLPAARRNEARRFVTLIDTLYDRRVRLIASAETAPEGIYAAGEGVSDFARTISRLYEMQSPQYWAAPRKESVTAG